MLGALLDGLARRHATIMVWKGGPALPTLFIGDDSGSRGLSISA
jgi:hypothetical protein